MNTMSEYYLKKITLQDCIWQVKNNSNKEEKNHLDGLNDEDVTTWIRVRKVMQHWTTFFPTNTNY